MVNELSRFQLRPTVPVHPGHCFICKGTKGPFIDTTTSIQWEGAVFICQDCIVEMHRQLGLPEPEPVVKEVLVDSQVTLETVLGNIRDYVNDRLNGANLSNDGISSDPGLLTYLSAVKADGEDASDSGESESDDGKSIERSGSSDISGDDSVKPSNKSNRKSGRSDVSSITGDDVVIAGITDF